AREISPFLCRASSSHARVKLPQRRRYAPCVITPFARSDLTPGARPSFRHTASRFSISSSAPYRLHLAPSTPARPSARRPPPTRRPTVTARHRRRGHRLNSHISNALPPTRRAYARSDATISPSRISGLFPSTLNSKSSGVGLPRSGGGLSAR